MIQRIIKKWKEDKVFSAQKLTALPKKKNPKQTLARAGERFAQDYLINLGWTILEQNWRSGRQSEIDIIARDNAGFIVFIEVKARCTRAQEPGFVNAGFESIDAGKKRRIITGARLYLAKRRFEQDKYRFDAIVLYYREAPSDPEVNHVVDIF